MTQGQVMFYSGAGLLAVTLLLAVFFWIKRPRYEPSSAVYRYTEERDTAKQRGTHSSAGLTQSGDGADDAATRAGLVTNTDLDATVTSDETVALGANEAAASDETVALGMDEAAGSDETVALGANEAAASDETVALGMDETAGSDGTVALGMDEAAGSDETVPMEEL